MGWFIPSLYMDQPNCFWVHKCMHVWYFDIYIYDRFVLLRTHSIWMVNVEPNIKISNRTFVCHTVPHFIKIIHKNSKGKVRMYMIPSTISFSRGWLIGKIFWFSFIGILWIQIWRIRLLPTYGSIRKITSSSTRMKIGNMNIGFVIFWPIGMDTINMGRLVWNHTG